MESSGLIFAAFITGFLGSLHCVGMCGAIACSRILFVAPRKPNELPLEVVSDGRSHPMYSFIFNLSRVSTYAILGAILAFLGQQIVLTTQLALVAKIVRISGAVLIALIGLRFLINLHWVDKIEKIGLALWSKLKIAKLYNSAKNNPNMTHSDSLRRVVMFGLLWGLLPCALVYTMLLTATVSGSALQGAGIMFAFGMGTLPAMQGMSLFGESVRLFARKPWLRQMFGVALIMIAIYVLIFNMQMNHSEHSDHLQEQAEPVDHSHH